MKSLDRIRLKDVEAQQNVEMLSEKERLEALKDLLEKEKNIFSSSNQSMDLRLFDEMGAGELRAKYSNTSSSNTSSSEEERNVSSTDLRNLKVFMDEMLGGTSNVSSSEEEANMDIGDKEDTFNSFVSSKFPNFENMTPDEIEEYLQSQSEEISDRIDKMFRH